MTMKGYWDGYRGITRGITRTTSTLAGALAEGAARSQVRPSRDALRTGILCPGDGPPNGSIRAFSDYRGVLLPDQVKVLSTGMFPLGLAKHPRRAAKHPVFLDWDDLATHAAVIGPSGTGKTFGVLAPWVVAAATAGIT